MNSKTNCSFYTMGATLYFNKKSSYHEKKIQKKNQKGTSYECMPNVDAYKKVCIKETQIRTYIVAPFT